jgi:hypothetical protein
MFAGHVSTAGDDTCGCDKGESGILRRRRKVHKNGKCGIYKERCLCGCADVERMCVDDSVSRAQDVRMK